MARPLRIGFPGALYHVMSRGNERRSIVRDDVGEACGRIEQGTAGLQRTLERLEKKLLSP